MLQTMETLKSHGRMMVSDQVGRGTSIFNSNFPEFFSLQPKYLKICRGHHHQHVPKTCPHLIFIIAVSQRPGPSPEHSPSSVLHVMEPPPVPPPLPLQDMIMGRRPPPTSAGETGDKRTLPESSDENRKKRPLSCYGAIPQHIVHHNLVESRPTTPVPGLDSAFTRQLKKQFDTGAKIYDLAIKLLERYNGVPPNSADVMATLRAIVQTGYVYSFQIANIYLKPDCRSFSALTETDRMKLTPSGTLGEVHYNPSQNKITPADYFYPQLLDYLSIVSRAKQRVDAGL